MNEEMTIELEKILPVVVRVHGDQHPELATVAELYEEYKKARSIEAQESMNQNNNERDNRDQNTEVQSRNALEKLRKITCNFTAPEDACPTFRKTYQYLSLLGQEEA